MKNIKFIIKLLTLYLFIFLISCYNGSDDESDGKNHSNNSEERNDSAIRLTFSEYPASCQNPTFSPDGNYILFTRFTKGYNTGPSELVKINISTLEETIIIPAIIDADHVNVPGTSWINNKICWASDRDGASDEIFISDDDGTNIIKLTDHPESIGYYIEPVFNPLNIDKLVFEYGPSDTEPHKLAIVERDKSNKVTYLTSGTTYDDRLPNWSHDGTKICFQRTITGTDNWQIYTAEIDYSGIDPVLININKIDQPDAHNTDNSWYYDDSLILSSSDYNIEMPNIYAFDLTDDSFIRITSSDTNEDGAPSCSPDGKYIAFESHLGQDEDTPSEIYILELKD